jgi:tRNA(adenine34) deaminase
MEIFEFPFAIVCRDDDERFMLEALKQAWKAYCNLEVPVGAVLVKEGKIIARGHNQVEMLGDATAHAEMLCLSSGYGTLENWRLADTTLYCTMEPCAMCAGAMFLSRISRLVWGTKDLRHGANGSWVDLFEKKHPTHTLTITSGVLDSYSAELLTLFFKQRRQEKVADKDKCI